MARRDCCIIFVIGLVFFTVGLPPEFLSLDARFALFAQEMLRNGPTFFPTAYGEPYPDYPATATFLTYLASLPFGHVTPFTLALPTAVASSLLLVVMYMLGALHSRRWGAIAVLMALFTKTFLNLSRCVSLDQFVSLVTALSFYLAYSGDLLGKRRRLSFIPLLMAMGYVFRGPLGVVVPGAVVCAYYAISRDLRRLLIMGGAAAIIVVLGWKLMLMAADYQGGSEFVARLIEMQLARRLAETPRHGALYYLVTAPAKYVIGFPLALITAGLSWRGFSRPVAKEQVLLRFLFVWMLVIILGLSLAAEKKIRYILPAIPPVSLLAAWLFALPSPGPAILKVRQVTCFCCKLVPIATFIYGVVGLLLGWSANGTNYAALAGFGALISAAVLMHARSTDFRLHETMSLVGGALAMALVVICVSEKAAYIEERSLPFTQQVESLVHKNPAPLVFCGLTADKQVLKFMVNSEGDIKPEFAETLDGAIALPGPAYIVVNEERLQQAPESTRNKLATLHRGRLDSEDCLIMLKQ
jgi:4-amino-4-deoxy-L-arabinose transferase-like glycosyltransferase